MKLWYHPRSPYSRKVLVALHEKEIPFERQVVPYAPDNEREKAELRRHPFNPEGQIPVLQVGDEFWPESVIIVEYVDQHFPRPPRLIPADPDRALRVRLLDRFFDAGLIQMSVKLLRERSQPPERANPEKLKAANDGLRASLTTLDETIGQQPFVAGEELTLADLSPGAAVATLQQVGFPLTEWPNVTRWLEGLLARPSWVKVKEESARYKPFFQGSAPASSVG